MYLSSNSVAAAADDVAEWTTRENVLSPGVIGFANLFPFT